MKTQTTISGITHEDLVNLLSTATYGSDWLSVEHIAAITDYETFEDGLAEELLSGASIRFCDYNAEDKDDFYGNLPHKWNKKNECMCYIVTLKDIEIGIAKAIDNGGFENECAQNLIHVPENFDLYEAEAIMQMIVFGELIYG